MHNKILKLLMLLFFLWSGALAAEDINPGELSRADYDRVLANPGDETVFQDFLRKFPQHVFKDGEVTRTFYIAEGDLLLTEQQMRAYVYSHASNAEPVDRPAGELLVVTVNGTPVYWKKGERNLTYAVDRKSFASEDQYALVVKKVATALKDWEAVCKSCGLSFTHRADLDGAPDHNAVTFIVNYAPEENNFIAAAFFPSDPVFKRNLIIGPQFFTTTFDKVGVLRHETGHIVGYRHEHIRGIPGCYTEDNNWKPLTAYDPHSVMHYFCGGAGTMDFKITEIDRAGHRKLYR